MPDIQFFKKMPINGDDSEYKEVTLEPIKAPLETAPSLENPNVPKGYYMSGPSMMRMETVNFSNQRGSQVEAMVIQNQKSNALPSIMNIGLAPSITHPTDQSARHQLFDSPTFQPVYGNLHYGEYTNSFQGPAMITSPQYYAMTKPIQLGNGLHLHNKSNTMQITPTLGMISQFPDSPAPVDPSMVLFSPDQTNKRRQISPLVVSGTYIAPMSIVKDGTGASPAFENSSQSFPGSLDYSGCYNGRSYHNTACIQPNGVRTLSSKQGTPLLFNTIPVLSNSPPQYKSVGSTDDENAMNSRKRTILSNKPVLKVLLSPHLQMIKGTNDKLGNMSNASANASSFPPSKMAHLTRLQPFIGTNFVPQNIAQPGNSQSKRSEFITTFPAVLPCSLDENNKVIPQGPLVFDKPVPANGYWGQTLISAQCFLRESQAIDAENITIVEVKQLLRKYSVNATGKKHILLERIDALRKYFLSVQDRLANSAVHPEMPILPGVTSTIQDQLTAESCMEEEEAAALCRMAISEATGGLGYAQQT